MDRSTALRPKRIDRDTVAAPAVSDRYCRRYFDNFAEVVSAAKKVTARELDEIATRWRQLSLDRGAEHAALGHEFTLYLLRNPSALLAATRSRALGSQLDDVDLYRPIVEMYVSMIELP